MPATLLCSCYRIPNNVPVSAACILVDARAALAPVVVPGRLRRADALPLHAQRLCSWQQVQVQLHHLRDQG